MSPDYIDGWATTAREICDDFWTQHTAAAFLAQASSPDSYDGALREYARGSDAAVRAFLVGGLAALQTIR